MTAESPKWAPIEQSGPSELELVDITPYQTLLSRVFGDEIEFPPLSPDKEQVLVETTNEMLESLPPKTREVLELRYGLSGQGRHTQGEVGQLLNPPISQSRVAELEGRALKSFQRPPWPRKLRVFLLPTTSSQPRL